MTGSLRSRGLLITLPLSAIGIVAMTAGTALAATNTLEWTDPNSGTFNDPNNWTVTIGGGSPPPLGGDTVNFNEVGTYTVTFTQNEASTELFVTAGAVGFQSDSSTLRTYSFTPDGGDPDPDIDVSGGTLTIGSDPNNPVFINGTDAILFVGVGSNGTLNVAGTGSRLDAEGTSRTHAIGGTGGDGTLNLTDGAVANIGTGFTLDVGSSNSSGTDGVVLVATGATLNTGNMDIADRTSGATGMVTVTGTNSEINQVLAGAYLTVGSTSGGAGTLDIENGGTFTTGTGTTTINATGAIAINSSGTLNTNGPVNVEGGSITVQGAGSFLNAAGFFTHEIAGTSSFYPSSTARAPISASRARSRWVFRRSIRPRVAFRSIRAARSTSVTF